MTTFKLIAKKIINSDNNIFSINYDNSDKINKIIKALFASFILKEMNIGVYGAGRAVQLYQLDGLKKNRIVCVGWTRSDGYERAFEDDLIKGVTTMDKIKEEAVNYIDKLLTC